MSADTLDRLLLAEWLRLVAEYPPIRPRDPWQSDDELPDPNASAHPLRDDEE